jgi:hypothetical protein
MNYKAQAVKRLLYFEIMKKGQWRGKSIGLGEYI